MNRCLCMMVRNGSEASLDRILGLIRRRCLPVHRIWINTAIDGPTQSISLALSTDDDALAQSIAAQLRRLPDVLSVVAPDPTGDSRELALVAISAPATDHLSLLQIMDPSTARLVATSGEGLMVELVSTPGAIDLLLEQFAQFGPVAVNRTGALPPPSGPEAVMSHAAPGSGQE